MMSMQRFTRLGGVSHSLLRVFTRTSGSDSHQEQLMQSLCRQVDISKLVRLGAHPESVGEGLLSDRLFHIKTMGEVDSTLSCTMPAFYQFSHVAFASRRVARAVMKFAMDRSERETRKETALMSKAPHVENLADSMFEYLALTDLALGGSFLVRRLRDDVNCAGQANVAADGIDGIVVESINLSDFMARFNAGTVPDEFKLVVPRLETALVDELVLMRDHCSTSTIAIRASKSHSALDAVLPSRAGGKSANAHGIPCIVTLNSKHSFNVDINDLVTLVMIHGCEIDTMCVAFRVSVGFA